MGGSGPIIGGGQRWAICGVALLLFCLVAKGVMVCVENNMSVENIPFT